MADKNNAKMAGTPDPLEFRRARPIAQVFKPGVEVDNTNPTTVLTPIAGALAVRLRFKLTTTEGAPPSPMGVLSFAYRRSPPNEDTAYSTSLNGPNPDVNVVKDTEGVVTIQPMGESVLAVTFTPNAGVDHSKKISWTFFDVMQQ